MNMCSFLRQRKPASPLAWADKGGIPHLFDQTNQRRWHYKYEELFILYKKRNPDPLLAGADK